METDEESEFHSLKSTLRRFTPTPLPRPLARALESAATERAALSDRILATWTFTGALAACFVAALTLWQLAFAPAPIPSSPMQTALHQQAMMEYQTLIASR